MRIRAQFDQCAAVRVEDYNWIKSPAAGVERMMLDRIGQEVARATTIVRFAAGSYFDAHTHGGGEEFLVLKGVFSDETGDYPAGTYVRNPIGTAHKPHTKDGCTIFVKLHQFTHDDLRQFDVNTNRGDYREIAVGVSEMLLHEVAGERVSMVRFAQDSSFRLDTPEGAEILVVKGSIGEGGEAYGVGSWLRQPVGGALDLSAPRGAQIWLKTGHLGSYLVGVP